MNLIRPLLFLCALFCSGASSAADYGIEVERAEVVKRQQNYVLNADINYRFSPKALDALQNGVPLTVTVRVKLYRYRKYVWNKTIVSRRIRFRLSYHALPRRFRVVSESLGQQQNFAELGNALVAMGQIRDVPLLSAAEISAEDSYIAQMKVSLDIEALPLPLRSVAYVIPQWYISSGWYKWRLEE